MLCSPRSHGSRLDQIIGKWSRDDGSLDAFVFRQKGDLFSSVGDSRAFLISTISSHSSALTPGTNFALYTYTIRTLPKDCTARRARPRSTRPEQGRGRAGERLSVPAVSMNV